jgi:hypothetical protein
MNNIFHNRFGLALILTLFLLPCMAKGQGGTIYHSDPNTRIQLIPDGTDLANKFFVCNGYSSAKKILVTRNAIIWDTITIQGKDYKEFDAKVKQVKIVTSGNDFSILIPLLGNIYTILYDKDLKKYIIK